MKQRRSSNEKHQNQKTNILPIFPDDKINNQKEKIQTHFILYLCCFLDEISLPIAFFIPIIGQLYLGARVVNNLEPLTKGNYSFFGCCSSNQINNETDEIQLDWRFSS